jgi:hypothetical protein
MKTSAGLWIDHREAVMVILSAKGQETMRMKSEVEKQLRRAGDVAEGPYSPLEVPRDDSREREYQGDLARYYDKVISYLSPADEVLIFGPGEAKLELKKRMEKDKGNTRILALETDDKMTEPQIVARVRQHFYPLAPRMGAKRQGSPVLNP